MPDNMKTTPAAFAGRCLERIRDGYRRLLFGVTPAEYLMLHAAQDGGCAICGVKSKHLGVDHDRSGLVRGLLCSPCSNGIGSFDENQKRLRSAADYLDEKEQQICVC